MRRTLQEIEVTLNVKVVFESPFLTYEFRTSLGYLLPPPPKTPCLLQVRLLPETVYPFYIMAPAYCRFVQAWFH
jgi:hypothetical protein